MELNSENYEIIPDLFAYAQKNRNLKSRPKMNVADT